MYSKKSSVSLFDFNSNCGGSAGPHNRAANFRCQRNSEPASKCLRSLINYVNTERAGSVF